MLKIIIPFILFASFAKADAGMILSVSVKNGPSGYNTSSTSSTSSISSTSGKNTNTVTTITNNQNASLKYNTVMGLKVQTVPDGVGLSFGAGYYFDNTVEGSIGIGF